MRCCLPVVFLAITAGVLAQTSSASTSSVTASTSATAAAKTTTTIQAPKATSPGGLVTCNAEPILTRCLETEQLKVAACDPTDYQCQCAAYEAVATCYNNCPDDTRRAPAQNQVILFCQQASLTASLNATKSVTGSETKSTYATSATRTDEDETVATRTTITGGNRVTNTGTFESGDDQDGAAPNLVRNTGGVLLAIAGVMAIMF